MPRGRKLKPVELNQKERDVLEAWGRRRTTAQGLATRSRIVLLAAKGWTNSIVAEHLHITRLTVGKWRSRFLELRLDGLTDEPRPGAPRKVSDADVERVITATLESTPRDATHWSTRSMAKTVKMSATTVRRIWHAFALQPHRVKTFSSPTIRSS